MRLLLVFFGLLLLAGCSTNNGPQRLDFVGTTRFTSSNRAGLNPADTLATRLFAQANPDDPSQLLSRLRITVQYAPKRNPFAYPTPISGLVRDSIDNNPDPAFIYLDTVLTAPATTKNFAFTSLYGVRTTSGTERWQYDLLNPDGTTAASRAIRVSVRRADSLATYHDYTLKLGVPASGPGARRFLQLRAGLALPAYSVLSTTTDKASQAAIAAQQRTTDLIVLADGLTIVTPDNPTLKFDAVRWPAGSRRATRIYPTRLATTDYDATITDAAIQAAYNAAATSGDGLSTGPLAAGQVYAYRADYGSHRYGLIKVISIPVNTTTTTALGLQLQVRTVK